MALGIGVGAVAGLVRNMRAAHAVPDPIRVFGPRAEELAAALAAGAESPGFVVAGGDPAAAAAVVALVDGEAEVSALAALRAGDRASKPLVAVRLDGTERPVPYVFATDVVPWPPGEPAPAARVATRLAIRLQRNGRLLAARLPLLREPVEHALAVNASVLAAGIAAAGGEERAHLPALTVLQAQLLLDLDNVEEGDAPSTPDRIALAIAPRLGLATAVGVGSRAAYRLLPYRLRRLAGPAIAFAATRALGAVGPRLPLPK